MVTDHSDEARISRMQREGKLSQQEAGRLLEAIRAQQSRDAALAKQIAQRAQRGLRRLLLAFIGVFFAVAIAGYGLWLLQADDSAAQKGVTATSTVTDQPRGRLIDIEALNQERRTTMENARTFSISMFVLVIAAIVGVAILMIYNSLIDAREKVNAGWAQVENQYQRRLDLVPVLVDGVKTYMDHERETLTALTEARANALGANSALAGRSPQTEQQLRAIEASQGGLQAALARLFAVVENYPDLKASENYLTLQDQMEGTENRIAIERRNYNEWARRYNTRTMKFPSNVIADLLGFSSKPYFQADDSALQGLDDPFGRQQQ